MRFRLFCGANVRCWCTLAALAHCVGAGARTCGAAWAQYGQGAAWLRGCMVARGSGAAVGSGSKAALIASAGGIGGERHPNTERNEALLLEQDGSELHDYGL